MNFKEICDLIQLVADKGIPLVEVEHAGVRVKVQGIKEMIISSNPVQTPAVQDVSVSPTVTISSAGHTGASLQTQEDEGLSYITAPMVGTFYRSPSPGADPFVEVGTPVGEGAVLCIIEAMKLMNEIESDTEGKIEAIYPKNGEMVEFGQKLFAIRNHT